MVRMMAMASVVHGARQTSHVHKKHGEKFGEQCKKSNRIDRHNSSVFYWRRRLQGFEAERYSKGP